MKSAKKGNNYYFGMKRHIGAGAESGFIHAIETTAANDADINVAYKLLHGDEDFMYGDAGYIGSEKRKEFFKCGGSCTHADKPELSHQTLKRKCSIKKLPDCQRTDEIRFHEKKSRIRAKVELPFHIIKNLFRYKKAVYRGIKKNTDRLYMLFALAKGMSTRDIEDHLRYIYGVDASPALISRITDKIIPQMTEWQSRQLDAIYAVVFLDGFVFKITAPPLQVVVCGTAPL